jgi:hypothetical protein
VDYDVVLDTLFFEVSPERSPLGAMASWARGWGPISFPDLVVEPIATIVPCPRLAAPSLLG